MPKNRTTTIIAIRTLLQIPNVDEEIFDTDISDVLIDQALFEYSRVRPQELRSDYIGNAQASYHLPSNWTHGFSHASGIHNDDQGTDLPLDKNTYRVINPDRTQRRVSTAISGATSLTLVTVAQAAFFRDGDAIEIKNQGNETGMQQNWVASNGNATTGVVALSNALSATLSSSPVIRKARSLRFLDHNPTSSEYFALSYTALHVLTETEVTIYESDYNAFVALCASIVAQSISSKFSRSVDPALDADSVDFGNLAQQWSERAKELRAIYDSHMALKPDSAAVKAGGAMRAMEARLMDTSSALTHNRRGYRR